MANLKYLAGVLGLNLENPNDALVVKIAGRALANG